MSHGCEGKSYDDDTLLLLDCSLEGTPVSNDLCLVIAGAFVDAGFITESSLRLSKILEIHIMSL